MSIRRPGIMTPKISDKNSTLFICKDCFKSIKTNDCTTFYYCRICQIRLCNKCYNKSNTCINGCKRLIIFNKKDEIRIPENLESFEPIIPQKINYWCCFF